MANKKLHVALGLFSLEDTLSMLRRVGDYVDIIELGTPLMVAEGSRAVGAVKAAWPEKCVFADIKVMDGGSEVPRSAVDAGCDMFSVLAAASDPTLQAAIDLAHEHGVKVLADFCNVDDMSARARQVAALGTDYLCCHVGYDLQAQGIDPVEELRALDVVDTPKAIAGGIKLETFEQAIESSAQIIISGGGIYNSPDPAATARAMREMVDAYNATHEEQPCR